MQDYEGFEYTNEYHLNEKQKKKENWDQAKIWIILGLFFGFCFLSSAFMHAKEIKLQVTGNSIVTPYQKGEAFVILEDKNGNKQYITLTDNFISLHGDSVKLYYYGDDIKHAKVPTALWFWLAMYILWLPLTVLCVCFAVKNVKAK